MKKGTKSLHRLLSLLLAAVMLLSCIAVTAFAAGSDGNTREAIYLGVPTDVADGVYYADVNMKQANKPEQNSMGNAALRGSESYKKNQPGDKEYRPIVIVKDGKATALLEFMPMGFLGMYGFMMELEGIYPGSFTQFGMPNTSDPETVFTLTQSLTYQKTTDGKIVYDGYNDPDSKYKFDGHKLRPAGFGKEAEYLNIVDKYYSHLLALDVTPVMAKDDGEAVPTTAAEYTGDHAAFCHVFVPVMFDMRLKRILATLLAGAMLLMLAGCVNQHPGESSKGTNTEENARLIATSPAVAQICSWLDLELMGVCQTNSTLPEKYQSLPTVGMAMNPDLEILKSLNPDYVLSPNSLQSDLQPKYASIGVKSIFLNLKSVEGMYASIQGLGEKFGREEQAKEMLAEFDEFMTEYKSVNQGKESPRVLVLMGLPGSYIVATESSYVGSLVKLAGGTNIYGDGDGEEFLTANTEDMQQKDPDIILRAAHALPDQVKEMFAEEFSTNDIWKHFRAVEDGRVYDLDPALFNMSANFSYSEALKALQPLLYGE